MPASSSVPSSPGAPAPRQGMGSMGLIFMLPLMMLVVLDPNIRTALGDAVGGAFTPVFGFGGQFPVWTLFITSVVLVIFTTVVRHFFTDWVAMGRQKHTSSWVQKQYRETRLKGNVTKMKKLNEYQAEMMKQSSDQMGSQLKTTMVTIVVAMAIFLWLGVFMYSGTISSYVSLPWISSFNYLQPGPFLHIMPSWIILYSLLSLPLGQILGAVLKIFSFRRKLDTLSRSYGGTALEGNGQ
jgi:uncharacterized membrane protein (DUF106 family)